MSTEITTILSPAKININLKVLSKRTDGYHNIKSRFQLIDLCDEITFKLTQDKDVIVNLGLELENNDRNIVYEIASKLRVINKIKSGVHIDISKNIPLGSGLGGGSSNAASTIVVLNYLWKLGMTKNQMIEFGKNYGADIPFFIYGKNAIAEGIGEKLTACKSLNDDMLLIYPNIHSSTGEMFSKLSYPLALKNNISNDFMNIFLEKHDEVREFVNKNNQIDINLSGTGSSMFIKYHSEKELQKLLKIIPDKWRFFTVKPLQYSPLEELF